jgi:Fe-S-cluster containining protein
MRHVLMQWSFHREDCLILKKKQTSKSSALSRRLHFPEEEKKLPWLPLLLDAYAIVDTGLAIAIRDEEKQRKVKLACGKGCGNCCAHQKDLPVYPHELVGIYWYVSEKMTSPGRDLLRARLAGHAPGAACPFLIDHACSIHPVRPIGCRQFNVFTKPCAEGEDPYYTRREDVLVPLSDYTDRAFIAAIPLYSLKESDLSKAVRLIRSQIMNLQTYDWKKLVAILDQTASEKKE